MAGVVYEVVEPSKEALLENQRKDFFERQLKKIVYDAEDALRVLAGDFTYIDCQDEKEQKAKAEAALLCLQRVVKSECKKCGGECRSCPISRCNMSSIDRGACDVADGYTGIVKSLRSTRNLLDSTKASLCADEEELKRAKDLVEEIGARVNDRKESIKNNEKKVRDLEAALVAADDLYK